MKKSILIVAILSIFTFFGFAGVYLNSDMTGFGGYFGVDYDCFAEGKKLTVTPQWEIFGGASMGLGWEFDTRDTELDNHWYAGVNTGFEMVGLSFAGVGGFTHKLGEFGPFRMELDTSLKVGTIIPIVTSGLVYYGYVNPSVDVILMGKKRTGFFGGLGISNINFFTGKTYKNYGVIFDGNSIIQLHANIGVRF